MTRAIVLALALAAGACGDDGAPPVAAEAPIPAPPADAIVKEQDGGIATIRVRVWPATPTLGDSIWLQLEVEPDPGVVAELPFELGALGRFSVLRHAQEDGRTTYELAAPMSGRHRIPPLRVRVAGEGEGQGAVELFTEEVPIEVAPVPEAARGEALRAARGALDTHVGRRAWWPVIAVAGGVVALGLGIGGYLAWRTRRARRDVASAWEVAMGRLAELEARGAPDPADRRACDDWFVALSSVVRAYVEGRYRLRAPELTTEEFLAEARRVGALTEGHRDLLGSFLARCDQVKFAGWSPAPDDSLQVLGAARAFVADTRPLEPESAA